MKFGLEIERFIINKDGKLVACPQGFPRDGEGLQLEVRGEPHRDIYLAVALAVGELEHLERQLDLEEYVMIDDPFIKVPRDLKHELRTQYAKERLQYQNLYGHKRHAVGNNISTAGIHLSVTNPQVKAVDHMPEKRVEFNAMWDFPQFFMYLDKCFADEIKAAKRRPGFYEIKFDGRVEYRSLPTNIDFDKLITAVISYKGF